MTSSQSVGIATGRRDVAPIRRLAALIAKEIGTFARVKLLQPVPRGGELWVEWYEDVAMVCDAHEVIAVVTR